MWPRCARRSSPTRRRRNSSSPSRGSATASSPSRWTSELSGRARSSRPTAPALRVLLLVPLRKAKDAMTSIDKIHPLAAAKPPPAKNARRRVRRERNVTEVRRQEALLKTGALQNAILNSANFSSIATDEKGVIQLFNVGAERMLGYAASEVLDQI